MKAHSVTRLLNVPLIVLRWLVLFGFSIDLSWWRYCTGIKVLRYDPMSLSMFLFAVYVARLDATWSAKFEVRRADR